MFFPTGARENIMLYVFHAGCGLVLCVLSGAFVLLCRRVIFFGNFIRALVVCSEYVVLRICCCRVQ